jgi:hypothetical protein
MAGLPPFISFSTCTLHWTILIELKPVVAALF